VERYQVYALGRDAYWLQAVARIADEAITVEPIRCPAAYPECLERLPTADRRALLLVDATGQPDVVGIVRGLRERGWQYVVVVAADPSWEEARAVLRGTVGHDYWEKSYVPDVIRRDVRRCLEEIGGGQEPATPDNS